MHARVALWQGDSTAADAGHLTLNPMVQMGSFSIALCCVIGIAWGCVPVNPNYMRRKYSEALVSFAGPLGNLILFVMFIVLCAISVKFNFRETARRLFFMGSTLNIVLFIFNMLPFPMLDGLTVFSFLFPGIKHHTGKINPEVRNGMMLFLFLLVFFSFDKLWMLGFKITNTIINFLINL